MLREQEGGSSFEWMSFEWMEQGICLERDSGMGAYARGGGIAVVCVGIGGFREGREGKGKEAWL